MRCPFCGYEDTKVIDSRPADGKKRRRRECTNCQKRFTTFEVVERPLLMVVKRDGSFEPFDRQKLIAGIYSAVKKRPVSVDAVSRRHCRNSDGILSETKRCGLHACGKAAYLQRNHGIYNG